MDRQRPGSGTRGCLQRHVARGRVIPLVSITLLVAGCCGYKPKPLDEQAILQRVYAARADVPNPGSPLSLGDATGILRRNNPEIREARAAWQVEEAVAKVRTPIENPSLGLGPLLFGGSDILGSGSWGLEGALGWTVPIRGVQRLTDQVNRVRADAAFTRAAAVERREYLGLRADYLDAGLSNELLEAWRTLSGVATAAVQTGQDMLEAGQASAVDVGLLRLDAARTEADVLDAAEEAMAALQALAGRINLHADHVAPPAADARPTLPDSVPALETLEALAIEGHPELATLRAEYVVTEKEFRLQVTEQAQDPGIGLSYVKDDIHEFGLPLGWELPIFDRNQPGIARAHAARDEARARYRAELARVFARISAARALVLTRGRTLDRLMTKVAPEAKRTVETTRQALGAGATDALSYLAVLSTTREASLDTVRTRNELFGAWSVLEGACGVPLLAFPDEPGDEAPEAGFPPPQAPNAAEGPKPDDSQDNKEAD